MPTSTSSRSSLVPNGPVPSSPFPPSPLTIDQPILVAPSYPPHSQLGPSTFDHLTLPHHYHLGMDWEYYYHHYYYHHLYSLFKVQPDVRGVPVMHSPSLSPFA
ncbi:hypothetical protein BU24DRAFT_455492 [Aaosphaeria arxii CBS 175.79]|uniref:Uncharacterized protein n=1 Tax=Aaosphaeria arxii CBS 175.79 TaxID=1450172 RepID=A0A6A5X9G6_9PLEO|nr:uncharacterized protein BU24DRAFT_455492 [Aaosphaeria arxii CBS 175.79]KAF2009526.1 hypothetical protein BU24DRAFT_455492 [Aaosphaeria arxii CBS 175.79]